MGDCREALAKLVSAAERRERQHPAFVYELRGWTHPPASASRDGLTGWAFPQQPFRRDGALAQGATSTSHVERSDGVGSSLPQQCRSARVGGTKASDRPARLG